MVGTSFELARREHAEAIVNMRRESGLFLNEKLGSGNWSGSTRIQSIRERIDCADPEQLRKMTLYVACRDGKPVGSVAVSTFPPGFWKRAYWREPRAPGLGVFNLVVYPELQGKGIGRFTMDGVEQLARDHGISFVRLDAYSNNPFSTSFYRHIGYEERARIEVRSVGLVLYEKRVLG